MSNTREREAAQRRILAEAAQGPLLLQDVWEKQGERRKLFFYARAKDATRFQAREILDAAGPGWLDGNGLAFKLTDAGRERLEHLQPVAT